MLQIVIVYIAATIVVGNGILMLGSFQRTDASQKLHREQAFYLAEAGLNYARAQLMKDNTWLPASTPYEDLAGGSYKISVDNSGTLISSTGTVNGLSVCTVMTVAKGGGEGGVFAPGLFSYSGVTQADINKYVSVYSSTGGAVGAVPISTDTARVLPPVIIPADLLATAVTTPPTVTITTGNYHFNVFNPNGVTISGTVRIYVDTLFGNTSSLSLSPGAQVAVYLGTTALFTMNSNRIINYDAGQCLRPASLAIYSASTADIVVANVTGTPKICAVIYAPKSEVSFSGNAVFSGGVVAETLSLKGSMEFHQDAALAGVFPLDDPGTSGGGGGITFVRWTKQGWKM